MSASTPLRRRRPGEPPSLIAAAIPAASGSCWSSSAGSRSAAKPPSTTRPTGLNVAILGALVVFVGCGFYLFVFRRRIRRRMTCCALRTLPDEED